MLALSRPSRHCAADRVAEQVDRLAHHALRGEVWAKAVTYCQQAPAPGPDERAAFREAVAAFEQALQTLAHLSEDGDTRGLAIDLRLAAVLPLSALGEHGRHRAVGRGRGPGPGTRRPGPAWDGCWPRWPGYAANGNADSALRRASKPSICAVALGDSALQRQAASTLGLAYQPCQRLRLGGRLLQWNIEAADRRSGTPSTDMEPISGAAGDDLGRASRMRRGQHHRGGGAPTRHAGRPRANTGHCPPLSRQPVPRKETWSTPARRST